MSRRRNGHTRTLNKNMEGTRIIKYNLNSKSSIFAQTRADVHIDLTFGYRNIYKHNARHTHHLHHHHHRRR